MRTGFHYRMGLLLSMLCAVPMVATCGDWPTYHGDAGLSGHSATVFGAQLELAWKYRAAAPVLLTPVASASVTVVATEDSEIIALDAEGEQVWSRRILSAADTSSVLSIQSPPVVLNGTVVSGTREGVLIALNAAGGSERWRMEPGGPIWGSVGWITDDTSGTSLLVMSQSKGSVKSVDLATGRTAWQSEETDRCDGSISVSDGLAVFGNCAAQLTVLSVKSGGIEHIVPLGKDRQVAGGVAVVGGYAYTGDRSGALTKVDLNHGDIIWQNTDATDEVFSTPAVSSRLVVYSCDDGRIYCVDRVTGKQRWVHETLAANVASPVISANRVLVTADGELLMLDLQSGKKLWSREVGDDASGPAVAGGYVIVGSDDGTVYAFRNAGRNPGGDIR